MDTPDDVHFNDLIAKMTALQQQNVEDMYKAIKL
jgi:hypothetical protein